MEFGPIPIESFGTFTVCILIAYVAGTVAGYYFRSTKKIQEKNQQ